MAVAPEDQPIETLREATIDQLVMNYGHNKISLDAFDRRLEHAMDAKHHGQLTALTEDLELQVDQSYLQKKHAAFGVDFENQIQGDVEYMWNILGGSNRGGEWEVPKEIRMFNIMGGGELDFTDAHFTNNVTTLKIYSVMGGATIFVPEGIRVKSKVFSLMGGYGDRAPKPSQSDCPTLVIEGLMFMGGADVKVKKPFKKRLLEFGNSIKTFLESDNDKVRSINKVRK